MAVDVELYPHMEMLRFTTAGSVDDGKSTLIGRLLYDSKAIFEDHHQAKVAVLESSRSYCSRGMEAQGQQDRKDDGSRIDDPGVDIGCTLAVQGDLSGW